MYKLYGQRSRKVGLPKKKYLNKERLTWLRKKNEELINLK